MKRKLLILISACVMICGCEIRMETSETTADSEVPVIATTSLTEEAEPEAEPYPVKINGVSVEKSPEHIVSLSPSLTEIVFEMGYGDRIVGKGSYCDYPAGTETITDVGRPAKPDYDAIINLKPEILLTATSIPVKDQYRLEENGIKTIHIPYPTSMEEFGRVYSAIGLIFEGIFDGEAAGEKVFDTIETAMSSSDIELGKFVYITEGLTIATGDTFESSVLSQFGTNIGAEGTNYGYSKEYLVEFQPELILLNDVYTIDDLLSDEIYSQLTAVVNGNVYCISNSYFERPSGRISELITALDEIG